MLFFRQLNALIWKNLIVLLQHWILNLLRCLVFPIGFGIFLATAQFFLIKPNNLGVGQPQSIVSLESAFKSGYNFYWVDATNGSATPSPRDIMDRVTANFSPWQKSLVHQLDSPQDIDPQCQQNFNGFSECFAAVIFDDITGFSGVNYTIRADAGLRYVNVDKHNSDVELRVLPLQWALDSAIIQLRAGRFVQPPQELPFTQRTNKEQTEFIRKVYIGGIASLFVLVFFVGFLGVVYHLPGSFMGERASMTTIHMQQMGLLDSARLISWHLSITLPYLPGYIIIALIWQKTIFTNTSPGVMVLINILTSFSLSSWSMLVGSPFGKSPQLAAIAATFLAILFAIIALVLKGGATLAVVYTLVFPPGFFVFAILSLCAYEGQDIVPKISQPDPDHGTRISALFVVALIDIFVYPLLALMVENIRYNAKNPGTGLFARLKKRPEVPPHPEGAAIAVRNLKKTFPGGNLLRRQRVTAIEDLSFTVPKTGIWILLGSNGAGKSTVLSMLGNLLGRDSGTVTFEGGADRPSRGKLGIVPQKNVLIPELSCYQTVRLWSAIKRPSGSKERKADLVRLLNDCDLGKKVSHKAGSLSGGQKRKLQLAIGLVGGSEILLVDEATSGVDPLSRRALWRALTAVKHERTIIFTTHFLDEADLLGDSVAVLAAPGRLLAQGTPVSLKSSLGEGYTTSVTFPHTDAEKHQTVAAAEQVLARILPKAPHARCIQISDNGAKFALRTKDAEVVRQVLTALQSAKDNGEIQTYDANGASLEDIFVSLMTRDSQSAGGSIDEKATRTELDSQETPAKLEDRTPLDLSDGRRTWFFQQAGTVFWKRLLIMRRAWLGPLLAMAIACSGACIPLFFMKDRVKTCVPDFSPSFAQSLLFPWSVAVNTGFLDTESSNTAIIAPPNALEPLSGFFTSVNVTTVSDQQALINDIQQNARSLSFGGLFLDATRNSSLIAFQALEILNGPTLLNLASNTWIASATSGGEAPVIAANYMPFAARSGAGLDPMKWIGFFAAAMGAFPAFFTLYVTKERRSLVQAMQLSNGIANPASLWLGHLLFDGIFGVVVAIIVSVVFSKVSTQFSYLGLYGFTMVLYGYTSILFAYCVTLFSASALAAFSIVAGYQVVMFMLYLSAYLLSLTYAPVSATSRYMTIIHYTMSLLAPINSLVRSTLISVNLFSLDCKGYSPETTPGALAYMGSPILYLILYGLILFCILVAVDGGFAWPSFLSFHRRASQQPPESTPPDVIKETEKVEGSDDPLRVLHVSKRFGSNQAVEDVSFGVARGTICALLGPNGAGKTTTFNMIRGETTVDTGDVYINAMSITHNSAGARVGLGVCPQFTAIDSQLTVREHLQVYGRLKGLHAGAELNRNIEVLLTATALAQYADRLASKLSGGNQRKLALAISLIGNPEVVLIDEFSTGIAPDTKRAMWKTFRNVNVGKSVVITTHSMEEATALANKVCIIARRMLAVGTTAELASRYPYYEIHLATRTRDELIKAQQLMARIPGSRQADDIATRWEVPLQGPGDESHALTLADLFGILSEQEDFDEFSVDTVSLESIFLKIVRENNVREEGEDVHKRPWWRCV
ncbi:ABC transporter A family member 6 AltName: Full=ABC transporter ABCA.6 [Serendipita indica DSM 11827]|uniref:Related to ATP-binding cassette, sub-family A n=1 Tax=Serendipita indica (strain DSM 11827) TaxID=1109443 RepID=G4TMC2_SERID|nr:ABC transporter A family member 6 AltName: Full=ABC transporter ABCA.6 [Serendipita indica DSM 11827]CCA72465.1 related to ATP-binding cassette, sub-family A [Serendipita indica DSM 11827]